MCRYEFAVTINNLSRRTMSNAREVVWSGSEQKNRTTYMNRTATLWHAPSRMRPRAKIIEGAFEHYRRHARAFFRGRLRVVRFVIDRRRRRFADLCRRTNAFATQNLFAQHFHLSRRDCKANNIKTNKPVVTNRSITQKSWMRETKVGCVEMALW